jgi:hypothetical protein
MKDRTRFNEDLNDESAIFLDPYFNTVEHTKKMTKTTFVALVREKPGKPHELKQSNLEIVMREITHSDQ